MCCKMVRKFSVRFEKSYGNWLPAGPNSMRFYLSVWDVACMFVSCLDLSLSWLTVNAMRCYWITPQKNMWAMSRENLSLKICDQARHKPAWLATVSSLGITNIATISVILSRQWMKGADKTAQKCSLICAIVHIWHKQVLSRLIYYAQHEYP